MSTLMMTGLAFIVAAASVLALYGFVTYMPGAMERRRVSRRLDDVSTAAGLGLPRSEGSPTIIKQAVLGPLPGFDRLMTRTTRGSNLQRFIEQSGVRISISALVMIGCASAVVAAFVSSLLIRNVGIAALGAMLGFVAPLLYLRRARKTRFKRFEEQFPEALDLLARAIKAGHAFTTGMGMVAEEVEDPVGSEFRMAFDEQNYGLALKDALINMTDRVPILDVRFFSTAVLIQRETGGNLSEILENLAHVVRERFKILRQVRVHTAHGRLTGYVLMALPAFLAVALTIINPEHMNVLFKERVGQLMLMGTITLQVIGYIWIQHVVKIEV